MFGLTELGVRELLKYSFILGLVAFFLFLMGFIFSPIFFYFLLLPFALLGFVALFFRDPRREIPNIPNAILSPADGTVTHLEKTLGGDILDESQEIWRLSIFLSIFDVHLNRAPFDGEVEKVVYKKGSFFDARELDSLDRNESNTIIFRSTNEKMPFFAVRQIVGLIARRIVCIVKEKDSVCVGNKIGMMKFGSRTDFIAPVTSGIKWNVKIGDKVKAGESILGLLPN